MTGDDDPDDRRTYPWADLGGTPDTEMLAHYKALARVRRENAVLTGRRLQGAARRRRGGRRRLRPQDRSQAALVVVNRGDVGGDRGRPGRRLPAAMASRSTGASPSAPAPSTVGGVGGGQGQRDHPGQRRRAARHGQRGSGRPRGPGAHSRRRGQRRARPDLDRVHRVPARYDVWTSPVSRRRLGQGQRLPGLRDLVHRHRPRNGVATLRRRDGDGRGRERRRACPTRSTGLPHYAIGWANLQWPPTMTHTISAVNRTDTVYGQVWIDGVTNQPGATPGLRAQLGFGPDGSDPDGNAAWSGWTLRSTGTPATTTSSRPACCPRRWARSTTPTGTPRPTAATGSTRTSTASAPATAAAQAGALDRQLVGRHDRPRHGREPAGHRGLAGRHRAWRGTRSSATRRCRATRSSARRRRTGRATSSSTVTDTAYVDTTVGEGETWHYRVVALDQLVQPLGASASEVRRPPSCAR